MDNSGQLDTILDDFAQISGLKILVHGGGNKASDLSAKLGIKPQMVNGRRITDSDTLEVITMVYAGLINKDLVARLQSKNVNAIGLSGADGNSIPAIKRPVKEIDYGFAGDLPDEARSSHSLKVLLENGMTPVFCALTHDGKGQLLNTNSDTIASYLAKTMEALCYPFGLPPSQIAATCAEPNPCLSWRIRACLFVRRHFVRFRSFHSRYRFG